MDECGRAPRTHPFFRIFRPRRCRRFCLRAWLKVEDGKVFSYRELSKDVEGVMQRSCHQH